MTKNCCTPIRTWAVHPLKGDKVRYYGRVLHNFLGSGGDEIARCDHEHSTRDEAQTCADKLTFNQEKLRS